MQKTNIFLHPNILPFNWTDASYNFENTILITSICLKLIYNSNLCRDKKLLMQFISLHLKFI
jgi:hypothetical protein